MQKIAVDEAFVSKAIPPRSSSAHKRMNGTVCVVGGSRLYHGAPFLCASGAMRSGVDLVYIAAPKTIVTSIRALSPDFIVLPLPDEKLTRGNVTRLKSWVKKVDCFAVGPGLGPQNTDELANCVNQLKGDAKLVLDADILRPVILDSVKGSNTVVTPHLGEFERLFTEKLPPDLDGRVESAVKMAKKWGVTILLKGPIDVITDGDRVGLNSTHSPAMTVGGTGDVLTGITAGLVAKGVGSFEAASTAAFINGSAGAAAARDFGMHITASDVANRVANRMKRFDRVE
jgi:ADP-dependent NAD(P)H-hydrate dehydratase